MFFTPSKKIFFLSLAIVTAALSIFFISCQKEVSSDGIDLGNEFPDLTTKINSSVSGFVTDENEVAVAGASIIFGSNSTATDKFGYFEVKNTTVTQNAAVVTILKPGYFKAVKTYIAQPGKSAFFRIKLLPKSTAGTIDAAAGGTVTLTNGLSITFPAGTVVNAVTNATYTGSVAVAAQWLNPTAADVYRTMPGDLRGLDSTGALKLLTTYGMSAVELTGTSGEILQIAAGKKATINFPLPPAILGTAPATIPLWYFDETKGLWKQEGNALKSGNNYVGEVNHFSYWNCDMPIDKSVQFSCTIVDGSGNPMPNVYVRIRYANVDYTGAYGYTDSSGYINGLIPANAQLILQVYSNYQCTDPVYTQQVTSGTSQLSLGNITVPPAITATISGNVKDCNGAPLANGYVVVQYGFTNHRVAINTDGTFDLNTLICSANNTSANIFAVDITSQQQGNTVTHLLVGGDNAIGTLSACGISVEEFVNYSVNGTNFSIIAPPGVLYGYVNIMNSQLGLYITGGTDSTGTVGNRIEIGTDTIGIAVNSTQILTFFKTPQINDTIIVTPIPVHFTEYGTIGEFMAGNFTGTFTGAPPANKSYAVTCSFRVKRSQ